MNITISPLFDTDAAEVVSLGLQTPELHIHQEHPEYYSVAMLKSFFTSPHDIFLGAKDNDVLAGYFLASYNPYLHEAYLIDMVVKPEYRGQGVATALFQEAFALLKERGCGWTWGLVQNENTTMMQILESKGFAKGKLFAMYYKSLEN